MIFLRKSLLDTLMQIFIMLWHLVAEISRFKFDDYRVSRAEASDLKLFLGGVYLTSILYLQYFQISLHNYDNVSQPCSTQEMNLKMMLQNGAHLVMIAMSSVSIYRSSSFMHTISRQRKDFINIYPYRIRLFCMNVTKLLYIFVNLYHCLQHSHTF